MKDEDNEKLGMYRKKWIVNMKKIKKKKKQREGLGNIKWSEATSEVLGNKKQKNFKYFLCSPEWGEKKKKKRINGTKTDLYWLYGSPITKAFQGWMELTSSEWEEFSVTWGVWQC